MAVCVGCRRMFEPKPGAAGLFCSRKCYEDADRFRSPARVKRLRNAARQRLLALRGKQRAKSGPKISKLHGISGYVKRRCRCDICKQAWKNYYAMRKR